MAEPRKDEEGWGKMRRWGGDEGCDVGIERMEGWR